MKLDRGAGADSSDDASIQPAIGGRNSACSSTDSSDDASIQPAIGGRNSACSSRYGPLIERGLLA